MDGTGRFGKMLCYISSDLDEEMFEVRIHVALPHLRLEGKHIKSARDSQHEMRNQQMHMVTG